MPSVTLTISDTAAGEVDVHCEFDQVPGVPCSMAQAVVLEIMARTQANWAIAIKAPAVKPAGPGLDMDAIYNSRRGAA